VSDDVHSRQVVAARERRSHLPSRRAPPVEQHGVDAGSQLRKDRDDVADGWVDEEDFTVRCHDRAPRSPATALTSEVFDSLKLQGEKFPASSNLPTS
jgi:hypothetical protein